MSDTIETCCYLWNVALADRKGAWEYKKLSTTYEDQCLMLTVEAKNDERLGALYSQTGQDVLHRLDRAFEAFFEHRSSYPRFKKYRESGSFTYPQAYNGSVKLDVRRKRIYLSKVGNVKIVAHRPTPNSGRLKTCTIERESNGNWYASLVFGDDAVPLQGVQVPASWKAPVGIDLGLKALITTSDGERVEPPKLLRKAERRLKRLQKSLSNKQNGSKNREKARRLLAIQHSRVSNQRSDFNHKLSNELVRKHDLVVFEDLRIRNMVRNHALAKSIHDAAWGQLVAFAKYKAARCGKTLEKVPAPYTTQECYFCGALNPVPLDVREFECVRCHRVLDRDVNAGRIVLKRGIVQVGQHKGSSSSRPGSESQSRTVPELKPVETGPLPVPTTGRASQVEEAGTTRNGSHTAKSEARRWKPPNSFGGGCHPESPGLRGTSSSSEPSPQRATGSSVRRSSESQRRTPGHTSSRTAQ